MKKKIVLTLVLLMAFSSIRAQNKNDTINIKPVLFMGTNMGFSRGGYKGLSVSLDVNYQKNKNLYTFKYSSVLDIEKLGLFYFIPYLDINAKIDEFSFFYGKRYIEDGFSYHFSGGISYSIFENVKMETTGRYLGFPIEIGVNWFKSKKKRFRILYGLIPVGKPTGFGRSIGFKFYANFAKKTYLGMGINFGLGWHKKYI